MLIRLSSLPLHVILAMFVLCLSATGASKAHDPQEERILSKTELETHLRFLAADELMGRETGTEGNDVAARYIAEQFRNYGLEPAPGSEDFFQSVPMVRTTPPQTQRLALDGRDLKPGEDFILVRGSNIFLSAPVVDADHGMADPGDGSRDLEGKVALVKFGDEKGNNGPQSLSLKRERLTARGAVAVIELYAGHQWQMFVSYLQQPNLGLSSGDKAEESIPHLLVKKNESIREELLASKVSITASASGSEEIRSNNVVGVLEGSDSRLRQEWVALTAHFDHVGASPDLHGATAEDFIFNGARDNGMGTVALLAAAKHLAADPPARSVIFIALTAEEVGLLGSSHYVENPAVPLKQTVFVLNNDGGGYNDTSLVTVLGLDRTTAREDIARGSLKAGLEAFGGEPQIQRFFNQSDNVRFAREGIPAPTFSPGFREFDQEILRFYHRPSDEADELFDFEYLLSFARAYAYSAEFIANNPRRPAWIAGDEYEDTAKSLYGDPADSSSTQD